MITGMEILKEELSKLGMNKAQIGSRAVAATLSVCANNKGVLDLFDLEKEIDEKKRILSLLKVEENRLNRKIAELRGEGSAKAILQKAEEKENLAKEYMDRTSGYIDTFYMALKNCDTAEGRDRLKLAQVFMQSIIVDTKYDNTAYIIGLAALLSGTQISPMEELKKVNKAIKL